MNLSKKYRSIQKGLRENNYNLTRVLVGLVAVSGAIYLTLGQADARYRRRQRSTKTSTTTTAKTTTTISSTPIAPAATANKSFIEKFDITQTIQEEGSMAESLSQNWWVNSGAYLFFNNGTGKTVQGSLPATDKWRLEYASSNPEDTDNGYHPQNIFRLITKTKWKNFAQQAYFKLNKYNLSSSSERYNPNGLLFFNRYIDGNNLYYTGVRVDGQVVLKKKINGNYYTVASKAYFPGTYNKDTNPNLIPTGKWLGLRSEVKDNADGTVNIKIYIDEGRAGSWKLILDATDNNQSFGGSAIKAEGYAGIRTDFMDAEFDDYSIVEY